MGCHSSAPVGPAYRRKSHAEVQETKPLPAEQLSCPPTRENSSHSVDLDIILFYQESHTSFVEFLTREHQRHHLDFYMAAKKYQELPSESKPAHFQSIYDTFLSPSSIHSLNLTDELKAKIFTSHEFLSIGKRRKSSLTIELNVDNFVTSAQHEVLTHLLELVKRFRRSEIFNQFMDRAIVTPSTKEKMNAGIISKRLLIITENTLLARILSKQLYDGGISVHHALNFASATSHLMNQRFDIALVGIETADTAGFKVAQDISKFDNLNKSGKPFLLAAMIIRGEDSTEAAALKSGFQIVVKVPFVVSDFILAIA